jgi:probable HAF family extracellular repeat protein
MHITLFALGRSGAFALALASGTAAFGGWDHAPLPRYQVTDLGTLGGASSTAQALNDWGQVVGWSETVAGNRHAFLYSRGVMQDLGTLTGGSESYATAINDQGQVVGYGGIDAFGPEFPQIVQGFIWDAGGMRSLGALFCPCSFNTRYGTSGGYAINDSGWVTGASETVRGSWVLHAVLWRGGEAEDLGGGAGDWSISRVFGINAAGLMVGDFAQDAGKVNAYDRVASLWRDGSRIVLGTLPGHSSSTALAVNGRGMAAGWSGTYDAAVSHAFLWRRGALQDLGTLKHDANSGALAINAAGDVVGWSGETQGPDSRAFLWRKGEMLDLNKTIPAYSGWVLNQASGINRRGAIVGTGQHDGATHAFLLTPVDADGQR